MALISEIADIIKTMGDVVKSTRDIIDAVNNGRKFLALKHPDAQQDFSDLIGQMHITIEGLTEVTKVINGFRFVYSGDANDYENANRELVRFNNYTYQQRDTITKLETNKRKLKGNCDKVRDLRDKLDHETEDRSWGTLFGLLGAKSQQRTFELHAAISNFYADDQSMIDLIERTLHLAEQAIRDVENELGPPGVINPYNLPKAIAVFQVYAVLFDEPHRELNKLADRLNEAKIALQTPN